MMGLHIKNLTTEIFQNLSFNLEKPGLYGLIGRNGVGKSTLFSLLNGEIQLAEGKLETGKVAYIPSLAIFDQHLSATDYLKLLSPDQQKNFQKNLDKLGGANFLHQSIGKYSLGMKELFAFLYVLAIESDLLILDELLDGLDEQRRFSAYDLLKDYSQEKIILFTSHNLSEVFKVSDSVYLLERESLQVIDDVDTARALIAN